MSTIATLAVKLVGDITDYSNKLNEAKTLAATRAREISASMQSIGRSMSTIGQGMTMGLTLPLLALGTAAVKFASDLDETRNKASVVFGDLAQEVLDWSMGSAAGFGMSEEAALAAAATYGNLFVTMGLAQGPAADMSMSLVGLAADLASFNNANPAEVLQAMQSGLVGQVEPLRRYGVVLSEAAVQAKALELGLVGADGSLSEAAKLQARYAIIMAQTGTAQGDFARTSDGMANSLRIVKAQLTDAGAKLGQQLLPYVLKGVIYISKLIEKFTNLSPATQKIIAIIGVVVAVMGPLLMIIGTLISAIGAIIPVVTAVAGALTFPLIAIILAVVGVVALLVAAWKNNWGGIRDKLTEVWNQILPVLQQLWAWLKENIISAIAVLKSYWTDVLLPALQTFWDWVQTNLIPVFQTIYTWFKDYLGVVIAAYAAIWNGVLLPAIQAVWNFIAGTLWPLFQAVAGFLGAVFGVALRVLAGIWQNVLLPVLTVVWNFIQNSLWPLFQAVGNFIGAVFSVVWRVLAGIWKNILLPAIQDVCAWLSNKLKPAFEVISKFVTEKVMPVIKKLGEWLSDKLQPAFTGIASVISEIIGWLQDMTEKLKNLKLPDWLEPGSPTPWEIGLLGIDRAIRKLSEAELPRLSTRLDMLPGNMPSGGNVYGAVAGGGQQGLMLANYGTLVVRTNGENVQADILRQIGMA